ncbi:response regulator [Larkinella knui]|nr:response regulator [Larkinella knui]
MKNLSNIQLVATDYSNEFSVLVVEDNLNHQLILHYLLRQQIKGVLPVGATSASQALAYLRNCHAQNTRMPAMILIDLYLPNRGDGWKLLRKIRSHARYRSIPVVIVSASAELSDIEQSYHFGANSYIVKPLTMEGWQDILPAIAQLV